MVSITFSVLYLHDHDSKALCDEKPYSLNSYIKIKVVQLLLLCAS